MTKRNTPTNDDLRGLILAHEDCGLTEAETKQLLKMRKAELEAVLHTLEHPGAAAKMASTLNKYRTGYEDTASHSGRLSKHNGDDVAAALAGAAPEAVIAAAELLLSLEVGELAAKYAHLNPGQRRMNAGNRIRAAVKRGDLDAVAVTKAMH